MLKYLDDKNLTDNTIVLFTSDHSTQGGSQGVNPWSKKNPFDASIHVPGIIRYPGSISPGTRTQQIVNMVDWFPTLCGLAGLRVPRSIEGQDRSEILRNNGDVEQDQHELGRYGLGLVLVNTSSGGWFRVGFRVVVVQGFRVV